MSDVAVFTTNDTKAASLAAITNKQASKLQREVIDVVRDMHKKGASDASMREIQHEYEATYLTRLELSTLSSAVNRLVGAGLLARKDKPRHCSITAREVMPIFVPAKQATLNM